MSATTAPSRIRRAAGEPAYLTAEQVLDIARAGARAGCQEALFTLGDKPELRYARGARRAGPARPRHDARPISPRWPALVLRETGLLPHLNPGVMTRADIDRLRPVSVSQGIMLESAAERLRQRGGPHFGSPDKDPAVRLATIARGGRGRGAVHLRHPDRHRRDAARAHRGAARAARAARPLRPSAGDHHPEFPRQARDRAWRRRPSPISTSICGRSRSRG